MVKERVLSARYAKALFELGREAKKPARETELELNGFLAFLKKNGEFSCFFHHPMIPLAAKKQALAATGLISPMLHSFFSVLTAKNRLGLLRAVAEIFHELSNEEDRVEEIAVTTARPLSPEIESLLEKMLAKRTGAKVVLEKKVDPELLGGMRIQIRNRLLDGSIRTKLDYLRQELYD